MNSKLLAVITSILILGMTTTTVHAQETPATESAAEAEQIFEQESLRPEIERLRISYRGIIEDYRNKERQYQIAKGDYEQLKTLRSLEEAVKATREAVVARTDVLLTYFELLKLELQESEGVELQRKQQTLTEIETEIIFLREYKETALAAQNREQVLALTIPFSDHIQLIRSRGYYSLSLIMIGRLQAVHDKSRILQSDIETYLEQQEVSDFIRSQRERGLIQTSESLVLVNNTLNKEINNLPDGTSQSTYTSLRDKLSTTYSQLSQSISYLKELLVL